MSDKDNIVQFPEREKHEDHEEHICDGCVSSRIHYLTHLFENHDYEETISDYVDRVFTCIDDANPEVLVDVLLEMWGEAYHSGELDVVKGELHRMAGIMEAMTNDPNGEEQ